MKNEDVIRLAVQVDRLVLESRLRDVFLIAQTDQSDRVRAVAAVISKLKVGAYLVGCGPYCCGVFPLTVDEIVLGRPPSPLEGVPDIVADYTLNDAVWLVPREASKIHATILRRRIGDEVQYWVKDENSRNGTYVNGTNIVDGCGGSAPGNPARLNHGDIISLGPSGVNSYMFIDTVANEQATRGAQ